MARFKLILKFFMAGLYIVVGAQHFLHTAFFMGIMPEYIPIKEPLVLFTGGLEILLGLMLFLPRTTPYAAWGLVAMLIVFMPVHIHMLLNPERFPGIPEAGLWGRVFLQFILILWAWWYTRPTPTRINYHHEDPEEQPNR